MTGIVVEGIALESCLVECGLMEFTVGRAGGRGERTCLLGTELRSLTGTQLLLHKLARRESGTKLRIGNNAVSAR